MAMTPTELQQALYELAAFDNTVRHSADLEPDKSMPMLIKIAVDEPYGVNHPDEHDRDPVYITFAHYGLERLKINSKGRLWTIDDSGRWLLDVC